MKLAAFAAGMSAETPAWANEHYARRTLWRNYGVAWSDMQLADAIRALALASAEEERRRALR